MSQTPVQVEQVGAELTLMRVSGLFEGMAAMDAQPAILEAIKMVKTPVLWFDMTDVAYIDSAAIAVLITAVKAASSQGTQIWLYQPGENVRKVLAVTNIDKIIPII